MVRLGVAERDHVAVESMGALARAGRAPSDADDVLRSALPSASGTFRVRTAQVLCEMTGDDGYVSEVAAVLESGGGHWGERIDTALALPRLPCTPRSLAALHRGVLDQEYLVRYHCANGLLGLTKPGRDIAKHKGFASVSGEDPARWRAVADEFLGAFGARSVRMHCDQATFAVELGPADYSAPHLRAVQVHLNGVRLSGPDQLHVPKLRNIGVDTTSPDHLRGVLEHLGFVDLPEAVVLGEDATTSTVDGRQPQPQLRVLPHGHSKHARRARLDQLPSRPARRIDTENHPSEASVPRLGHASRGRKKHPTPMVAWVRRP
ncbi:hypothetical protein GCM10017774_38440 [Lentzea cavernae]|uniref:DUF222 domain-containing protein n=2 Tax=Lentzea cavernae TaxID=2020703 RepID=A0ABQ3MFZ7_9PSEU|nr:hypothetical protein GCM10017774_38440 [Lentzea cavernae]